MINRLTDRLANSLTGRLTNSLTGRLAATVALGLWAMTAWSESAPQEIYWTAQAPTVNDAREVQQDLYLNLFNTGRLPFQLVDMGDYTDPEDVMRASGAWVGPASDHIAVMLCVVNGPVCRLDSISTPSLRQSGHGLHVAGITSAGRKWTIGNDVQIWIPDVKILQVSTPVPAEPESIVEHQGLDIKIRCLGQEYCMNDYQTNIPDWNASGYLRDAVVATIDQAGKGRAVKLVPELNAWIKLDEEPLNFYDLIKSNNALNHEFHDPSFEKLEAEIGNRIIGSILIMPEDTHSDI